MGDRAEAYGYSVAVGAMTQAKTHAYSTAVGYYAIANAINSTAIGSQSAGAEDAVAVGRNAGGVGTHAVAIGMGSSSDGFASVAVGHQALADHSYGLAWGYQAEAQGECGIAIGPRVHAPTSGFVVATRDVPTDPANPMLSGQFNSSTSHTDGFLNVLDNKLQVSGDGSVTIAGAFKTPLTSGTDGATITFDLNEGNTHNVTLGGSRTLAITNASVGQKFLIRIAQSGAGSQTVTWFNTIKWAEGGTAPTLTTTGGKADLLGFLCIEVSGSTAQSGNFDGFIVGQNI